MSFKKRTGRHAIVVLLLLLVSTNIAFASFDSHETFQIPVTAIQQSADTDPDTSGSDEDDEDPEC